MLQVVKNQDVKENETEKIKQIKKEFSISPKVVKRVLLTGVGAELIMLCNHGYNFYKSGVGLALNLPYCNTVIPYWFLVLAILSPTSAYWYKWYKKLHGKVVDNKSKNDELAKMIGKYYDR